MNEIAHHTVRAASIEAEPLRRGDLAVAAFAAELERCFGDVGEAVEASQRGTRSCPAPGAAQNSGESRSPRTDSSATPTRL